MLPFAEHALLRAKQRYNAELSSGDLEIMARMCRDWTWGVKRMKAEMYGRREVVLVYLNMTYRVIYDLPAEAIVTFLYVEPPVRTKLVRGRKKRLGQRRNYLYAGQEA